MNAAARSLRVQLGENEAITLDIEALVSAAGAQIDEVAPKLAGLVDLRPVWQPGNVCIRAGQTIGTIETGQLRLEVRPRLAAREAAALVRYAWGGKVDATLRGSFPMGQAPGLDELLCHILADECDQLRRVGLSRLYRKQCERLEAIRGRADFLNSFPWDKERQQSVACVYHLLTCDNLDNRLVRAALEHSTLLQSSPRTRSRLLAHRRTWSSAAEPMRPARDDYAEARRRYNRLTQHYRLAHNIGELISSRKRPTELFEVGLAATSGLMISMPLLFEKFVERLVVEELAPPGVTVVPQQPDQGAILDGVGKAYRRVRPDLVLYRKGRPIAVVDAKYKEYWSAEEPSLRPKKRISNADLYQLFFYAQRLQLKHHLPAPPAAYIVSPLPAEDERGKQHEVGVRYRRIVWRAGHECAGDVRLINLPLTTLLRSMMGKNPNVQSLLAPLREALAAT